MSRDHFGDRLKEFIRGELSDKKPFVWGTCSGLIMMANDLENQKQGGQYHVCIGLIKLSFSSFISAYWNSTFLSKQIIYLQSVTRYMAKREIPSKI